MAFKLTLLIAAVVAGALAQRPDDKCCPDGTFIYGESCYTFVRDTQMTWKAANELCKQRGETMFVPNTAAEFNAIRTHAHPLGFTWLGAVGAVVEADDNEDNEGANSEEMKLRWEGGQKGMPENELPWTISSGSHGRTDIAECLVYFHSPLVSIAQRVSFLPCDTFGIIHHVICEKNSTLSQ